MKRIYHTWDEWECYPAGFYGTHPPKGMTSEECQEKYRELLASEIDFRDCLDHIVIEWKNSCEHYLTNEKMNRIAWLGQAALAWKYGIPAQFRGGYNLLTEDQKQKADDIALEYLNLWMTMNGHEKVDINGVKSKTQANLY